MIKFHRILKLPLRQFTKSLVVKRVFSRKAEEGETKSIKQQVEEIFSEV